MLVILNEKNKVVMEFNDGASYNIEDGTIFRDGIEIGYGYLNCTLIEKNIPQTITPRQCRLQLLSLGLLDEVEALCASDRDMQIWFEYSLDFQRNHEMIIAMALQLGMTELDMDNFFIEASKL